MKKILQQNLITNLKNKLTHKKTYPTTDCTAIVPWGTNLGLTLGFPLYTKIIREMISLPYYQMSVAVGVLLSDGWTELSSSKSSKLESIKKRNACFKFKQSLDKFEYFMFVFNILSHYCSSLPSVIIGKRNNTVTYGLHFFTRALPCFTDLHNLFYIKTNALSRIGQKIVPTDIFNMLNDIALAHIVMCDGGRHGNGLTIYVNSFTLADCVLLINVLIIKFELNCTIQEKRPQEYVIYIRANSMDKLRKIVLPHMVPSMLYKLGL